MKVFNTNHYFSVFSFAPSRLCERLFLRRVIVLGFGEGSELFFWPSGGGHAGGAGGGVFGGDAVEVGGEEGVELGFGWEMEVDLVVFDFDRKNFDGEIFA